ncbi:MAG TPA: Mrp/NBP35 family ATP-binding protein [Acidimicrobiales bacterium]|nr:Mrp/NBP35 family ATP-binding protein [Acidimicrobiales bacterium]
MPALSESQVLDALAGVDDPQIHQGIVELGLVRHVAVGDGRLELVIALVSPEAAGEMRRRVGAALEGLPGAGPAHLELTTMSDPERDELAQRLDAGRTAAIPFAAPGSRTRVLLVASGKGGVGKSSVTVNLAIALARRGRRVCVVDADVWGFSVPAMLGIDRSPTVLGRRIVLPPEAHGVACASIGFFVREDQPVVWRGPMLHKALEQFLTDFWWGEPDFLVVDLPPGTGDISLSLASFLPRSEAYVVTTPQPAAQRVAQRAGLMFQSEQIGIAVHGVIENMSWFTGDDGTRYELFGAGGGRALAERLGVPLVGQVPLVPALREGGDAGRPITVAEPEGEAATAFAAMARQVDEELGPTRRDHPGLRVIGG